MAFVHRRMAKRRLIMMEAQNKSNNGGEVRRLHIVYFLSRNGRIEHPHLIRLNHLSTNCVRLRDVKRWLGELRGKDMAESFAWSYKRKYKTGYLWQDLFDDDLITPISDNEYVLKGSEISSATTDKDKSNPMQKDQSEAAAKNSKESSDQTSIYASTKSSPSNSSEEEEEEEQSPIFTSSTSANDHHSGDIDCTIVNKKVSSSTDAASQTMKREEKNFLDSPNVLVSDKTINKKKNVKLTTTTASSKPQTSNGSSNNMLRNLITCGRAVETNDSAIVVMNKQHNNHHSSSSYRPLSNMCSGDVRNVHSAEVYGRREKKSAGGSDIVLQNTIYRSQSTARMKCNEDNDSAKRSCEGRDISASYKPINGPLCSLCKKQFKPEKLHAHMTSCKGRRKTMFKSTSTNLSHESSTQSIKEDNIGSRYLLVDGK